MYARKPIGETTLDIAPGARMRILPGFATGPAVGVRVDVGSAVKVGVGVAVSVGAGDAVWLGITGVELGSDAAVKATAVGK